MSGASRFVPGELVHDRYRIVALLGRGGMGEVYRAEDLKLDQEVALKFLPSELDESPEHLERFLAEVRVARKVSHPGVCRVHDVGEVDGQHYLSMEYVDGEDLASLLRRIGRLPQDKAIEIAHQLCAGLAAAHEQGVLHRDLKPANVMIDGEGGVRIADFGLAAVAAELGAKDVRVGTPKYMAPEQLAGKEVTARSDLFSLGLVLFELFTGRPAFEAKTLEELVRAHEESQPSPSAHLPDIDAAVEAVLVRCLSKNPADRPASAHEIAAGLPGGDPLAAALAAGEVPSPEPVAAAGAEGGLSPRAAGLLAAGIAVSIGLFVWFHGHSNLLRIVEPELPPQVLEHRAREIAKNLDFTGLDDSGSDWALGSPNELYDAGADEPWHRLAHPHALAIRFWWRGGPDLAPWNADSRVRINDPPLTADSWANVSIVLGHDGRLYDLVAPPGLPTEPFDWGRCFREAFLELEDFDEVEPTFTSPFDNDDKRQWRGTDPETPEVELTIYGAALHGRPVYFRVSPNWNLPRPPPPARAARIERISSTSFVVIQIIAIFGSLWIGARNVLLRRGDRRNANRVALAIFLLAGTQWVLQGHHTTNLQSEFWRSYNGATQWLAKAALAWLMYVALEPTVRANWPQKLVSWTRLLSGRVTDAAVGRDVLVGTLSGFAIILLMQGNWLAVAALGDPHAAPHHINRLAYVGVRNHLGELVDALLFSGSSALLVLFLYVILLRVVRKHWIAIALLFVIGLARMPHSVISHTPLLDLAFRAAELAILLTLVSRAGLVAILFALFTLDAVSGVAGTFDFDRWTAGPFELVLTLYLGLTVFGWWAATRRA
ncbi:MAG: serine/threonine protein kinase [bacterium]|nr:serine/threonine protein kinase [bacterium]